MSSCELKGKNKFAKTISHAYSNSKKSDQVLSQHVKFTYSIG